MSVVCTGVARAAGAVGGHGPVPRVDAAVVFAVAALVPEDQIELPVS